jgi:hypothetical protein
MLISISATKKSIKKTTLEFMIQTFFSKKKIKTSKNDPSKAEKKTPPKSEKTSTNITKSKEKKSSKNPTNLMFFFALRTKTNQKSR